MRNKCSTGFGVFCAIRVYNNDNFFCQPICNIVIFFNGITFHCRSHNIYILMWHSIRHLKFYFNNNNETEEWNRRFCANRHFLHSLPANPIQPKKKKKKKKKIKTTIRRAERKQNRNRKKKLFWFLLNVGRVKRVSNYSLQIVALARNANTKSRNYRLFVGNK